MSHNKVVNIMQSIPYREKSHPKIDIATHNGCLYHKFPWPLFNNIVISKSFRKYFRHMRPSYNTTGKIGYVCNET